MKKIILLVLTALMMGCEHITNTETEEQKRLKDFNIVVIDSCEYLKKQDGYPQQGFGYMAHKGNCRFCKERRQKELEELVIKLKEK